MQLEPVAAVESPLVDPAAAPKQGDEGAPEAWLIFEPHVADALAGVEVGAELLLLTWLDRAVRNVLVKPVLGGVDER
jgi:tRNA (Thr-GGU) A37 N-methylase